MNRHHAAGPREASQGQPVQVTTTPDADPAWTWTGRGQDDVPMTSPAAQAHALHAAAILIKKTGIPGLSVTVDANLEEEIRIQVPEYLGTPAERTAAVAKLAAAADGTATRKDSDWQDNFAWVLGAGTTDGHSVRIFTSIPASYDGDAEFVKATTEAATAQQARA
jgi:hypothetical protein